MVHITKILFLLLSSTSRLTEALPPPEHLIKSRTLNARTSQQASNLPNLSAPSSLQERASSSRLVSQCNHDETFFYSYCDHGITAHENDLSKHTTVCLTGNYLGNVRHVSGRCGANEFCSTRFQGPILAGFFPTVRPWWRAHCVMHTFYVNLINSGKPQQQVVSAAQLGLPSGEGDTARYGINALVVGNSRGQVLSVNATSVDMVAVQGNSGGGGNIDTHCDDRNEVGFDTIPARATRFIVGVTLQATALMAMQVVFDVYEK